MNVLALDERAITSEIEAVFVVRLYEAQETRDLHPSAVRGLGTFALYDATFVEVMAWIAATIADRGDVLWALGVMAPEQTQLIWIHGGDPAVPADVRTRLEGRRVRDMELMRASVFRKG